MANENTANENSNLEQAADGESRRLPKRMDRCGGVVSPRLALVVALLCIGLALVFSLLSASVGVPQPVGISVLFGILSVSTIVRAVQSARRGSQAR